MDLMAAITLLGLLCGLALLGFGALFLLAPDKGLRATSHSADRLPFVMAGRYAFFGALLIAALFYADHTVTGTLLAGFAGLGLFDAALYRDTAPLPHLGAGLLAAAFSAYFLTTGTA